MFGKAEPLRAERRHPDVADLAAPDDTVLVFVSGLIIATLALLADLIVRSRSDG